MFRRLRLMSIALLLGASVSAQETNREERPARIQPTHADIAYGEHPLQVLDLYLAPGSEHSPLVVHIHGGGFRAGSKRSAPAGLIRLCHQRGISVASIDYRLTGTHAWPAQHHDGRRAVQFLRHHAEKYRLDPRRVACTGNSAGAGISLWLAFHDDMADPASDDPVARQSTRLAAVACAGAQTSYDPHWIKSHIGGRAHLHPALAPLFGHPVSDWNTPAALAVFEQIAAINHYSRDDPPVWLVYREADQPLPKDARLGAGIHHPRFGHELKKLSEVYGLQCTVLHSTDLGGKVNQWPRAAIDQKMAAFFGRHLQAEEGGRE